MYIGDFYCRKKSSNIRILITFTHTQLTNQTINIYIMAKSQDAKKTAKKEPLKTAKEKKDEKREKKNAPKRD